MVSNAITATVPAKIPRIAVYLSEKVKDDLEALAGVERRSLSQMAAILIENALQQAKAEGKLQEREAKSGSEGN